ncbi:MAG TPA: nitrilase-related carbon-nitrogen hydrolase [Nitrospiria bacterium]|nr:nitrilase-related carbon-nitrogen hydrolase [Nitrospiria bacterium]
MRVGFVQIDSEFGNIKGNIEKVAIQASRLSCDLVVLPELFSTGYQFVSKKETLELSEEVPSGSTARRLIELAGDYRCHLVAGLAERKGKNCYNSALLVGPRGIAGLYRKTHLFFEEKKWFTPGDTGFQVFTIGRVRIGIMVCFDWIFPEAARTLALRGAEVIAHPSNLVLPYCPEAMKTRCIENRVFAVTANRVGFEKRGGKERLTYIGQSEVVSPRGEILYRASSSDEEAASVEIDPRETRSKRINAYNDLFKDRRRNLYED